MKVCTKCDRTLPLDQFHRKGDRRKAECRDCCRQYQAERVAKIQHTTPTEKPCSRCRQTLPASKFAKDRYAPSGLQANCNDCLSALYQERKAGLKSSPVTEKRCPKCKQSLPADCFAASPNSGDGLKAWCRECSRLHQIERLYKIAPDRYRSMAKNGCQICGSFDRLHVDHDHTCCPTVKTCGQCVRGILCERHNQGLGFFQDDPESLVAGADYLKRYAALPIETN